MAQELLIVKLRPVVLGDAHRMYRWMLDPVVSQNLGLRSRPTLARTRNWIRKSANADDIIALAIEVSGKHVGNIVFDRIDGYISSARLSIYIGAKDSRLRGVGTGAVKAGLKFMFEKMRLNKIWLTVHCKNEAAYRAYLRAGFTIEGTLREEFMFNDRRLPVFYMGILKKDFLKQSRVGRQRKS